MSFHRVVQQCLQQPFVRLVIDAVNAWQEDRAASLGAALAYYTLFSMAPLLLIVVSVAGLVFGEDAARGEIFGQLRGLMGANSAAAIEGLLASMNWPAGNVLASLFGLALMLVGATSVFAELQAALDHIWQVDQKPVSGLWALLRARLLSFGLVLGIGFLLIVSLLFSAAVAALQKLWTPQLQGWENMLDAINMSCSFVLLMAMFAMIYKLMPSRRIAWKDVWIGALITTALFTLGRGLISFYLAHSAVASGFGAAGSIVVLLVWVYYSAQIFLLGAELTWVYAHQHGSLRGQAR